MIPPPCFELVVQHRRACVERRADRRIVGILGRLDAIVLKLLADGRSVDDVGQLLAGSIDDDARPIVQKVHGRFASLLKPGCGIAAPIALEDLGRVDASPSNGGVRDMPGPKVLQWAVTRFCPRRCVYCYAEPEFGGVASDASLTRAELVRIFREAVELGAEHLLAAGAEPFLRDDLPEVLGDAIACGLTPNITTKHPIGPQLAARLAAARVRHVSLSLDSLSPQTSLMLIGTSSYPDQVRRSAAHLHAAGVEFSIQAVATPFNLSDLEAVVRFAADAGAIVVQVVPFEDVRRPIAALDNDAMTVPDVPWLADLVEQASARYPHLRCELFDKLGAGARAEFQCDIGATKLFFLPNGIVHRCYKLVDDETLMGKDLREVSVAEAWHDPAFGTKISPPRDLYAGSTCGACSRFDACHADGRCIFQAKMTHQTYYAPDRVCDGPFPPVPSSIIPVASLRARS
jgi:radical SAM protein with 4Fe4S-binding SPASM domain